MARPTTLREAAPGLRRTLRAVRPHLRGERRLLAGGAAALFAEVALRLLEPWPLKVVLDAVVIAAGARIAAEQGMDLQVLVPLMALAVLALVVARAGAAYLMTVLFALAGNRVLTRVRADLFAHLQRLPLAYHERSRTGDLVTRVTSDVARLQETTVTAALPLLGNVVTLAGMLVVIAFLDWQLALLVLAVFPAFAVTSTRLTRRITSVSRGQRHAEGALASLATESLGAMKVVQAYGLEGRMQERFAGSNERTLKDGVQGKKLSAGLERKTDALVGVATAVVLYVGAQRVLAGALSPGELVVFLTYLKTAFKPMRDVAKYTGRIAKAAASGERVVDVLETRNDLGDASWARPAPRLRGHVGFEGVWMSYVPGRPVLRGLDLRVRAGERVAVVGASGAGKSTLAALLSRLRDPELGRVTLDGHDLRDLTLASVRSQVTVVLQESVLFAATVRENIAAGRPGTTDAEVEAAARLAGAHAFVERLPQGYDTVVGERGATLSGGQRQRIAIARAAVRDAPVVVLDEALTGLDDETGGEVAAALDRLCEGRTTLVITHDLDAALDADRLVWLDGGVVADQGRPAEVLARRAARHDAAPRPLVPEVRRGA
ncbi:ABC transporter ATP-binding protein [Vallicoccus soli]|uniref:ABC transporter ATP-binding protein n=1 Tax=Vallicoccus soli TaxID=2339232 RepID=A0A3A3YQV6_9ACTN|nr:ABC transporter ATP-binding protein [Vallicoccus soli]RJK93756.1 ABC transporter ATP-binding protein [Vallicoccus soli]